MIRFFCIALMLLALTGCGREDAQTSCYDTMPVAQGTPPVMAELADSVTPDMNAAEIFKILGPAARDVGSGLHILEWDVVDGRIFTVSTADLCMKPHRIGFRKMA